MSVTGCGKDDDDDDKKEGGCKKGGPWEDRDKPEVRPPWKPGQCVSCPEGAKTHDGVKCGESPRSHDEIASKRFASRRHDRSNLSHMAIKNAGNIVR